MKKLLAVFSFLLLLIPSLSKGQSPYFQRYFLLRKNEPVQINAVFQDKGGFVWFGTNKGLFKFDGTNQQKYTKANGLPDENVTAIAQDSAGRIWTGQKNGTLAIFEKGTIKQFTPPEGSASKTIS